jgi:hypothetical protein
MARAVRHVGLGGLVDIAADEQGDFEPEQRGFVVLAFTAIPRSLHGDDGAAPPCPWASICASVCTFVA